MQATVDADAEWEAKEEIIKKIYFHKIEKINDHNDNPPIDFDIIENLRKLGLTFREKQTNINSYIIE